MARQPAAHASTMPRIALFLACLAASSVQTASAGHLYTGVDSFINTFETAAPIELPGATLRMTTAADIFGLGLTSMSALHITLAPCTVLQPHIHPHGEFTFTVSGEVTHSVVYNNATLTTVLNNTKMNVGSPGYAVFPAGQLHVTQNEGCEEAVLLAVFPVGAPDLYFFPYTEAYLPANTVASFFGGKINANDAWKPVGTAPLAGCKCGGGRRMR